MKSPSAASVQGRRRWVLRPLTFRAVYRPPLPLSVRQNKVASSHQSAWSVDGRRQASSAFNAFFNFPRFFSSASLSELLFLVLLLFSPLLAFLGTSPWGLRFFHRFFSSYIMGNTFLWINNLLPRFPCIIGILEKRMAAFVPPSTFFPVGSPDMCVTVGFHILARILLPCKDPPIWSRW